MNDSQAGKLPPCELSSHCLRLLDDLTEKHNGYAFEQEVATSARDRRDERLVVQMRAHLPHCPTCADALDRAKFVRSAQRAILQRYLDEGQAAVSPTTARILQAVREREQPSSSTSSTAAQKRMKYALPELFMPPSADAHNGYHAEDFPHARTTDPLMLAPGAAQSWLRTGVALATVAALIVAAVGIFGHFMAHRTDSISDLQTQVAANHPTFATRTLASPQSNSSPVPLPSPGASLSPTAAPAAYQGWNGLVIITGAGAVFNVIYSYNYQNGDHRKLAQSGAAMQFDGVGSAGRNMLYHVVQDGYTLYYTLSLLPSTGFFYELDADNALNAIWMPDNVHVLIATVSSGVIMVNTQTGQSQPFLPTLKTSGLKFYRGDYLYFLGGAGRPANMLFRVNVKSGLVQQVAGRAMDGDFWLSPDGSTVYYDSASPAGTSHSPAGRAGIYAASSDGTSSQALRTGAQPIGYAPDDALVVMRQVNQAFEVIQLGATPAQDRVLLADAAPGATSLCNPSFTAQSICGSTNIALAPFSHALVVIASYPDGSRKVWSDDLVTGRQFVLMQPTTDTSVMIPGWDTIAVA
jgi:predicted heme/steroid binding protein